MKANLHDEDALLTGIPRFEIPKVEFEKQVLREMKTVLKDCIVKINDASNEELLPINEVEAIYKSLENFEYPHKDKLLDFIKYFFLETIVSKDLVLLNYQALKDHLNVRKSGETPDRSRNQSYQRSGGGRSRESSKSGDRELSTERKRERALGQLGSDGEEGPEEERMLDIAEQCFLRIADLLHISQKTVR